MSAVDLNVRERIFVNANKCWPPFSCFYRKKRGSYGGLGVASNFLNMYDPSRRHLQVVQREAEWKRDEDDDGDKPPD